jgi:transcriptional regulator with XRE-family HTH domain
MQSKITFLKMLRDARTAKGLTQAQMAAAALLPLRTYQRAESGDPGARLDTVVKALDALGLDISLVSKHRPTLDELAHLYGNDE